MELKYIMFDECLPVIFGEYFGHDNVKALGEPTSAGKLSICFLSKSVQTYGQSLSLRLKPGSNDDAILTKLFFPL